MKECKQKIQKRGTSQCILIMPIKITGMCLFFFFFWSSFLKYMIPNTGQGIVKQALTHYWRQNYIQPLWKTIANFNQETVFHWSIIVITKTGSNGNFQQQRNILLVHLYDIMQPRQLQKTYSNMEKYVMLNFKNDTKIS